jgi:flagella basal body P-ring formation protein FlgA
MRNGIDNNESRLRSVFALILCCLGLCVTSYVQSAYAQVVTGTVENQNLAAIKQKVEEFLLTQSVGAPGKVVVTVGAIDKYMKLAHCAAMETSLPTGSRAWGKTTVAVHCALPGNWTIYVQAKVSVFADYLIAAAPLAQGRVVADSDMIFLNGDLTTLPPGIFTDVSQVIGQTVGTSLGAGTVLRQEMLRSPLVVKQGQTVHLVSVGKGFSVTSEGSALGNGSIGQIVQVKAANGNVVSGIARNGGEIEINF